MRKKKKLSPRENEVYNMLIDGETRKNIADKLCIAKSTLEWHILHIFQKKEVKNRVELVNKHYEAK